MPGRLRQKAAASSPTEPAEKAYDIPGLDFHETLTWRAGKAIPVADLLARLQSLNIALRNTEQDRVESRTYTPLANDLANANLLGHKDKGIRAWTVSCIVDVLKICVPDAPFQESQLKDIFTVIIHSILPALADPTNAYNSQHIYILNSLADSQSILLVTDIPQPESLISTLFTNCFDIVSGSTKNPGDLELSKSVEYHLKNLLCAVVEEVPLPQDVTDIIISQFMRVDARAPPDRAVKGKKKDAQDGKQSTLLLKEYPQAYNMAKSICTACSDKMTAQITQYFGTVIVDASALIQNNGHSKQSHRRISELEDSDEEQEELADLRKAHRLLRELWRACPDVLVNVIPQIEAELSTDSIQLRQLATETLGDIAAGIGIAGLPPPQPIDPAAFPLPSIEDPELPPAVTNPLLTPASPKPFAAVHASAYQSYIGRSHDRAPAVRSAWVASAARILFTSAGGIGISNDEREELLSGYAQMLRDHEERVRIDAIRSIANFTYHGVVNVLCADGGLSQPASVLSTLAERVTDRKLSVREEAIPLMARIWGGSSKDVENGNEQVISTLGDIPTRLLSAYYTNEAHIHALLDKVMFDDLLPLSFPPVRTPTSKADAQKSKARDKDKHSSEARAVDPDSIRARRILTFVRGLDLKSKQVFFGMQGRQAQMQKGVMVFLKACEDYNGGVVEDGVDEERLRTKLGSFIDVLSKQFPDPSKMAADLWKFAKLHNRRDYQLIRYATSPEYDYRTMYKAIKELTKRIREGPTNTQSLIDTLMPLLYRCGLIVYNRSHVPAIMSLSRSDENGLADVAHEILKEISVRNPEVLKTHIQDLCKELENTAPSATKFEEPGAGDTLKACAGFARKYPSEVSRERKFLTALTNFALFSKSPRAAKNAVTIILTIADKKEMYAKEIMTKALKNCQHTSPNFLARLAAIAQVCLLAPAAANSEAAAIRKVMVTDTLLKNRSPSQEPDPNAWEVMADEETVAKELSLKILVNRCRSENEKDNAEEFTNLADTILKLLMQLIGEDGEITPSKDTPAAQRNRLRLVAARLVVKLCSHKRRFEELVTPSMFVLISLVIINPPNAVRSGFINQVKKYLGQNRLNHRWFTVLFLLAFEPDIELKSSTVTWLRSRVQYFARQQKPKITDKRVHQNVMESVFARLLSLLAHHPDYPDKDADEFDNDLLDFSRYIIFYLVGVATEENLSLIFHIAQRVKQTRDAVTDAEEFSERLYVLSDLAQAVIRNYADLMPAHAKGVNLLQTWPGSVAMPRSLFKALPSHEVAQEIVERNYLPEETAGGLEKLIRSYVKSTKGGHQSTRRPGAGDRKRKSGSIDPGDDDDDDGGKMTAKRPKKTSLPLRKTPKPKRKSSSVPSPEMPARKSARKSGATTVKYAEGDSEEDDAEMEAYTKLGTSPTSVRARKKTEGSSPPAPVVASSDEEDGVMHEGDATGTKEELRQVHEDNDADEDDVGGESGGEPSTSPLKETKKTVAKTRKAPRPKTTPAHSSANGDTPRATRQSQRVKT